MSVTDNFEALIGPDLTGVLETAANNYFSCFICKLDQIGNENDSGSLQPSVIFLLRNILEIPSRKLNGYLKMSRGSSRGRVVELCGNCRGSVDRARTTFQEILEATKKYRQIKREIIKTVKKTADSEDLIEKPRGVENGGMEEIARDSRKFVLRHKYDAFTFRFFSEDLKIPDRQGLNSPVTSGDEDHSDDEGDAASSSDREEDISSNDDSTNGLPIKEERLSPSNSGAEEDDIMMTSQTFEDSSDPTWSSKKREQISPRKRQRFENDSTKIRKRRPKMSLQDTANDPHAVHAYLKTTDEGNHCRCGKIYTGPSGHLLRHIWENTLQPEKLFQCEVCETENIEKTFKRKEHLKRHMESVHTGYRSVCPHCRKSFPAHSIAKHVKTCRSEEEHI